MSDNGVGVSRYHDVTNGELARSLDRVEKKLDKVGNDHETRIRKSERMSWAFAGVAATGGATGIGSFISQAIGG